MSLGSTDFSSSKIVNLKIDGEVYQFHISSQQNEDSLLRSAEVVNKMIGEIRQEISHLGYPSLLVFTCLNLAKSFEENKVSLPSATSDESQGTIARLRKYLIHLENMFDDKK